ncbi:hypothetical protein BC830DRAFT_1173615 [Chytriomyces sp. MP71]|nr:hypothetical protein BC830DRAFT_1173615 [Chytriomyces sp. MP71]
MHIDGLPTEVLTQILVSLGPSLSQLRECLGVSKRFHASAWAALSHSICFENMYQRSAFVFQICLVETGRSVAWNKTHATRTDSAVLDLDPESSKPLNIGISDQFRELVAKLRSLDFGFRPNTPLGLGSEPNTPPNTPFPSATLNHHLSFDYAAITASQIRIYGSCWEHRFVADDLTTILRHARNLRSLNLSGCQIRPDALDAVLDGIRGLHVGLRSLDLSNCSLKGWSLLAIVQACASTLSILHISGLFRFRRNMANVLHRIVASCPNLEIVIAKQCPDIDADLQAEVALLNPRIIWVRSEKRSQPKPLPFIPKLSSRSSSSSRLDRVATIDTDSD